MIVRVTLSASELAELLRRAAESFMDAELPVPPPEEECDYLVFLDGDGEAMESGAVTIEWEHATRDARRRATTRKRRESSL